MQLDGAWARAWAGALAHLIDSAHLATGADLSRTVDRSVGPLGLSAEVLMVDLAQQVLMPVRQEPVVGVDVEGPSPGGPTSTARSSGTTTAARRSYGSRCSTGPTGSACCGSACPAPGRPGSPTTTPSTTSSGPSRGSSATS
ncbi:hypothetical protein ACFQV8_13390 [Pseudonocardia benzenivorans]